ncbi:hypothetical protein FRB94_012993 [Tulasnella sp. JGI-2019a]|nr:hypothetical protein FRB94_012993 [Tulasnella sp. JGI-2019a]
MLALRNIAIFLTALTTFVFAAPAPQASGTLSSVSISTFSAPSGTPSSVPPFSAPSAFPSRLPPSRSRSQLLLEPPPVRLSLPPLERTR